VALICSTFKLHPREHFPEKWTPVFRRKCERKWWEVDGIEPLAKKGLRLQRSDGTSLSLFALPEFAGLKVPSILLQKCEAFHLLRVQQVHPRSAETLEET
jgi:hypothetical protein